MAQTPLAGSAGSEKQGASIPNFSRVWNHPAFPWFEPPASGPGPITNLSRWPVQRPQGMGGSIGLPPSKEGIANYDQMVGDYKSPILQPWAAAVVKRFGEMSLAGITYPNPSNQCWPFPTAVHLQAGFDADDPGAGQDPDVLQWSSKCAGCA